MQPDSAAPADPVTLLRQQVILAQVRIMELEDVRDELSPRLAETERLLINAQLLADQKADESLHLEKVRADLQAQCEHLRHVQHVTHVALEEARSALALIQSNEQKLRLELASTNAETQRLRHSHNEHLNQIASQEAELQSIRSQVATGLIRIQQLDAEQRALKSSRSWRWTAWLRSLERHLGGGKP